MSNLEMVNTVEAFCLSQGIRVEKLPGYDAGFVRFLKIPENLPLVITQHILVNNLGQYYGLDFGVKDYDLHNWSKC